VRRGIDGPTTALVVEADLPIARLRVTIDDGLGRRDVELEREEHGGLLAGAIDLAPNVKASLVFTAYDADGTLTHEGKGTLVPERGVTPQEEFPLVGVPGTEPASVRIGTYRLALSPSVIDGEPGRETRIEAVLLDARGERRAVEKGTLAWMPGARQKELGSVRFDYHDYVVDIRWIPERWFVGVTNFCTFDSHMCARLTIRDRTPVVQVATGQANSCALRASGLATCWGDNYSGRSGTDGTGASMIDGWHLESISLGATHGCGVDDQGLVRCWGANANAQLGAVATPEFYQVNTVNLPAAAIAVTTGEWHSCALLVTGEAWCWGYGRAGQLGDGSALGWYAPGQPAPAEVQSATPVLVAGGHTFTSISAGGDHTCGLTAAGEAWCWGANQHGESGVDLQLSDACFVRWHNSTPVWYVCAGVPHQVQTTLRFTRIDAGLAATCAVTSAGEGYCWGNPSMQDPPPNDESWVPRTQAGFPSWKRLVPADQFDCGIDVRDMIECMGINYFGELGTNSAMPMVSDMNPVAVQDVWTDFATGHRHSCGVRAQRQVVACWGLNTYGQLGRPSSWNGTYLPVDVTVTY
jgi:alpha-tubulin suppressor-like RCC1 family protein